MKVVKENGRHIIEAATDVEETFLDQLENQHVLVKREDCLPATCSHLEGPDRHTASAR